MNVSEKIKLADKLTNKILGNLEDNKGIIEEALTHFLLDILNDAELLNLKNEVK